MSQTIAVADLRIGMFIQLQGGWLSHPFPLSSFRIDSEEQMAVLRKLGLRQVQWIPARSDAPVDAAPLAGCVAPAPSPPTAAEQQRSMLAAQRAATGLCEQQHHEAARAWRKANDAVAATPQAARATTEALAGAMRDKMLGAAKVRICLVNGVVPDRAAAHALNVTVASMLIGRAMGLEPSDILDLGVGALMHDVGKCDLPEALRHHSPGMSAGEINGYREHVAMGVLQGQRMALSAGAMSVLAQHHESADGSGFPLCLPSERMTVLARIVAIVNRYDNLCNPSTRQPALSPHEAVSTLFAQSGSRFDAAVLSSFIRLMGVYPAGSLVQLTDDRFALVTAVNAMRPLKPCVLVHDAKRPRSEVLMLNLELEPNLGIRRSLTAAKLPAPVLAYLDPRPRVSYYFESQPALEPIELIEELAA